MTSPRIVDNAEILKEETPSHIEDLESRQQVTEVVPGVIKGQNVELYAEALEKYGQEGTIDPEAEKRLKRYVKRRADGLTGSDGFSIWLR